MRWLALTLFLFGWPFLPAQAQVDLNIVTGIDASDSVDLAEMTLQYEGMIAAALNPEFTEQVSRGKHGRVALQFFEWSSGGDIHISVPWIIVDGPESAQLLAANLRSALADWNQTRSAAPCAHDYRDCAANTGMTAIGETLEAALKMAVNAPHLAPRAAINITSDGISNHGKASAPIRDAAVNMGHTVSAVLFGGRLDLEEHFRNEVVGGPGHFVMDLSLGGTPPDMVSVMARKLLQDMIAGAGYVR